jgi:hypothetical protein
MHPALRHAFETEMATSARLYAQGEWAAAFRHLETAHVLGQHHVMPHARTHYWMLKIGIQRRALGEVWGQAVRIVLGMVGSAVGIVPRGNTGGTDIGMFKRLPLDPGIEKLIK